ncbi:MAG: hypothetical protein WKG06_37935 [Segetibacter sp.]
MNNKDQEQDPQLQAPQEANTTRHINFLEAEEGGAGTAETTDSANDDSPPKKAWEELRQENSNRTADKE